MSSHAQDLTGHESGRESAWSGGTSPYAIGSNKLGMWLFIVSDAITFSALLVAYSYIRTSTEVWPRPFESASIINASIMSFVLMTSSVTMVLAVRAARMGVRSTAVKLLVATLMCGVLFDILHLREWFGLFHKGVTPWGNPWGTPLFGATFFGLTGLHMTHVTIGVFYLAVVAFGTARGKYNDEVVEVAGLYWHFVDLVWMFIFPMVYLLSAKLA